MCSHDITSVYRERSVTFIPVKRIYADSVSRQDKTLALSTHFLWGASVLDLLLKNIRHCDNALFDAIRFFEVALYSFLIGNSDMHLKNFSLLHREGGSIALSPAYDLLPTQLLLPEDEEESALTLIR